MYHAQTGGNARGNQIQRVCDPCALKPYAPFMHRSLLVPAQRQKAQEGGAHGVVLVLRFGAETGNARNFSLPAGIQQQFFCGLERFEFGEGAAFGFSGWGHGRGEGQGGLQNFRCTGRMVNGLEI